MLKIKNIIESEKCVSCGACVSICPNSCISFKTVKNGFSYPIINEKKCINCKLCDRSCPQLKEYKARQPLNCHAISSKNNDILKNSSSGGFFYSLAKYVISLNGLVYGANLNKSDVNHVRISTLDQLAKLMGSKYSQSNMGAIFKDVKKDLENNQLVLFTGTPCQIQGLLSFLDKSDTSKLITMDLICRGIPNPSVFSSYFNYLEHKFATDITKFSFRSKKRMVGRLN